MKRCTVFSLKKNLFEDIARKFRLGSLAQENASSQQRTLFINTTLKTQLAGKGEYRCKLRFGDHSQGSPT